MAASNIGSVGFNPNTIGAAMFPQQQAGYAKDLVAREETITTRAVRINERIQSCVGAASRIRDRVKPAVPETAGQASPPAPDHALFALQSAHDYMNTLEAILSEIEKAI